jgi:hypothetical protein
VCAQHCPQLKRIKLVGFPHVTNHAFQALVATLAHQLRSVVFVHCVQLGDDTVVAITEHCLQLEYFRCFPVVSGATMTKVRAPCGNLQRCKSDQSTVLSTSGNRTNAMRGSYRVVTVLLPSFSLFVGVGGYDMMREPQPAARTKVTR